MTDDASSLKEDIGFLRSLAEAGRNRPLVGGSWLVAAGFFFGAAPLANWALIVSGQESLFSVNAVYWTAAVLFLITGAIISVVFRDRMLAAANTANQIFAIAWQAAGIGSGVISLALLVLVLRTHAPVLYMSILTSGLCLYGGAWLVCWKIAQQRWMFFAAVGADVFALLFAALPFRIYQLPLFSAPILLFAF